MTLAARLAASFGGIALFLLAGNGLLRFFPSLDARPFFRRLAWAWLLGVAGAASALFALDHMAGMPLKRQVILPLFLVLAACALLPRRRRAGTPSSTPRRLLPARVAVAVAALVGVIVTAGLFSVAVSEVTRDWDGQMSWVAAARWIRADGTVDSPVLREERWYVSHPQYPPLLPLAQVALQETFAATDDTRVTRPLYAMFFPAFLLVLFDGARRRAGTLAAALVTLVASLVPLLSSDMMDGGAGTAYADFPLACLWGGGLLLLLETRLESSTGIAAGLLLGAGVLAKNEGLPLAFVALAVAATATFVRARRRSAPALRALRPVVLASFLVAAAIGVVVSWKSGIVNRHDEGYDEQLRRLPVVRETLKRLPLLPGPIWKEMADAEAWAGFWWCAPVVLLAGAGALRRRPAHPLLLGVAGAVAVYLVAYGITPWKGAELVHPTWNRFLIQLSIPCLVLLAMALRAALRGSLPLRTIAGVSAKPNAGMPKLRPVTREALVFAGFFLLTVVMTWPWVRHIRDHAADWGDPYLSSWILWWDFHQTFHDPLNLFQGNIFFPYRYTLAFSEHHYGLALPLFPLFALGLRPLTAQSLLTLLGFAFSGYGAFRLARTLTGSTGAAWVAGIGFAFVPFRFQHLSHVVYLSSGWIPVLAEAVVLYLRKPDRKRAAWLGGAFLMNALTVIHWFVLTLIPLAATFGWLLVRNGLERRRDVWRRAALAVALAGLVLLPFLLPYRKVSKLYGMERGPEETLAGSARPHHWLTVDPRNRFWSPLGEAPPPGELSLFPGLVMPLLAVAGLFLLRPSASRVPADAAAKSPPGRLLVALDLLAVAAGTIAVFAANVTPFRLTVLGREVLKASDPDRALVLLAFLLLLRWSLAWPRAFTWAKSPNLVESLRAGCRPEVLVFGLIWLILGVAGSFGLRFWFHRVLYELIPLFRSIRIPARWAMVADLGLAVLAGAGALALATACQRRRGGSPRAAAAVFAAAGALLLFEQRVAPLQLFRGRADPDRLTKKLATLPMKGGVVELPSNQDLHGNYEYVLRAADHGKPLVNGVSGFNIPIVQRLEELSGRQRIPDELLDLLESIPTSYVTVREAWLLPERREAFRVFLARGVSSGRLRFQGRFDERVGADLYAVAKTEPGAPAETPLPWTLSPAATAAPATALRGPVDLTLAGGINDSEPGATVRGELVVAGWARIPGEDLEVTILIDGEERTPLSARRVPRDDVARALPRMGDCRSAGFEARYAARSDDAGPHELLVLFRAKDGRYRPYPIQHFTWSP